MNAATWQIGIERPDQPEVRALIDALDAYQAPMYPPESNHLLDLDALLRPEVIFVVARDAGAAAVGCGAVVLQEDDKGEIKRMFLRPAVRGGGLAAALLARLESEAAARGCVQLQLETGIHQHAALAFYERSGYRRCAPFGSYAEDPLSVFMHRRLG